MRRTADRPIPSGRITAGRALAFGVALSAAGFTDLWLGVNLLAALLGLHVHHVAVTAHTGEGLTAFGRGEGILATVILSAHED